MKRSAVAESGIYLRIDELNRFLDDLSQLSVDKQAIRLGMSNINLRRARKGFCVGHRTIAEVLIGTAAIAQQRKIPPPSFEQLFAVETPARQVASVPLAA